MILQQDTEILETDRVSKTISRFKPLKITAILRNEK